MACSPRPQYGRLLNGTPSGKGPQARGSGGWDRLPDDDDAGVASLSAVHADRVIEVAVCGKVGNVVHAFREAQGVFVAEGAFVLTCRGVLQRRGGRPARVGLGCGELDSELVDVRAFSPSDLVTRAHGHRV